MFGKSLLCAAALTLGAWLVNPAEAQAHDRYYRGGGHSYRSGYGGGYGYSNHYRPSYSSGYGYSGSYGHGYSGYSGSRNYGGYYGGYSPGYSHSYSYGYPRSNYYSDYGYRSHHYSPSHCWY